MTYISYSSISTGSRFNLCSTGAERVASISQTPPPLVPRARHHERPCACSRAYAHTFHNKFAKATDVSDLETLRATPSFVPRFDLTTQLREYDFVCDDAYQRCGPLDVICYLKYGWVHATSFLAAVKAKNNITASLKDIEDAGGEKTLYTIQKSQIAGHDYVLMHAVKRFLRHYGLFTDWRTFSKFVWSGYGLNNKTAN
ncbi:hypothetical protein P171DRAFT_486921 [Karstenula rhodostoma CBS 690.94]|uniref:Uncharacterized protein n=1 Tax=Karstenula rhodostoma CBS 690.94 TaxID=1392251 RepID=A0A9P4UAE2_9PLEO|nr:hypothetical protein P171DRAFT_486921 [Karstenula rhodostoma CBS 690.94]